MNFFCLFIFLYHSLCIQPSIRSSEDSNVAGHELLHASLNKKPPESIMRMRKLESLKADILKKLQLDRAPSMSHPLLPDVPSLRTQVKKVEEESLLREEDRVASGSKLFRLSEPVAGKSNIVFFNLTRTPIHSQSSIHEAIFCLFIKKSITERPYRRTVLFIHDGESTELLTRHEIKFRETGTWVYIDLTLKVRQWQAFPESNHGVEVTCTDNVGASLVTLHSSNDTDRYSVPVLEIELSNSTQRRRKRQSTMECEGYSSGERCCRYPMVVNFTDFGWDYIIAPKTINTYICRGECPTFPVERHHTYLTNANRCCVPKTYSPISIIYYDHNSNIIIGKIPGIVVKKCFCI